MEVQAIFDMNSRALKRILVVSLAVGLIFVTGLLPVQAESSFLTSRINQIESRLSRLGSQLNQVQSQVNRLAGGSAPVAQPVPQSTVNDPSLEAQFDNLAILAIELRDRIIDLETRLADLEPDG